MSHGYAADAGESDACGYDLMMNTSRLVSILAQAELEEKTKYLEGTVAQVKHYFIGTALTIFRREACPYSTVGDPLGNNSERAFRLNWRRPILKLISVSFITITMILWAANLLRLGL